MSEPKTMSSTPTIRISRDQRRNSPRFDLPLSSSVSPMSIPGAHDFVPPPLPPPTHIHELARGSDPGWQWGNDPSAPDFGKPTSVKAGSSLLGSSFAKGTRLQKEHDNVAHYHFNEGRRGSSISTITAGREQDMMDEPSSYGDDDTRPNSKGYVNSVT